MQKRDLPQWTMPFLREVVRTGDVRGAALRAGIEDSAADERRKADPNFAAFWLAALRAHGVWMALKEQKAAGQPLHHSLFGEWSPSPSELREEL